MKLQRFISLAQAIHLANPADKVMPTETWKYRYLVWNSDNNSIPSVAHRTKRLAREELMRLKTKCPDAKFVLLKIEAAL